MRKGLENEINGAIVAIQPYQLPHGFIVSASPIWALITDLALDAFVVVSNQIRDFQENHVGCLPHEARCDLRRTCRPPQSSLHDEPDSNITCNGCGCQRCGKLSRDVVVRSELAGTGSTHDTYEFSEIWLNSKVRGICFYAVTAFAAIILFVPMLLEHPFVLMFDRYRRKVHYLIAKTWAFLTVAPFVKIEYEGLENLPPTDTPADWLKQCMALIKKGASVFFFPEGTRSKDGKLGPFEHCGKDRRVPIVPISLIGIGEIMPPGFEIIVHRL